MANVAKALRVAGSERIRSIFLPSESGQMAERQTTGRAVVKSVDSRLHRSTESGIAEEQALEEEEDHDR